MRLETWLKLKGLTDAEFARGIGRDKSTVGRIRRGQTRPDWLTMIEIARETEGAVTPNDFADPSTSEAAQ